MKGPVSSTQQDEAGEHTHVHQLRQRGWRSLRQGHTLHRGAGCSPDPGVRGGYTSGPSCVWSDPLQGLCFAQCVFTGPPPISWPRLNHQGSFVTQIQPSPQSPSCQFLSASLEITNQ